MKKYLFLCLALLLMTIAATNASAQSITSYSYEESPYSCGGVIFVTNTTGCASGQNTIAYFGDGTSDTAHWYACTGTTGTDTIIHLYGAAGTYTVKLVLFSGSTHYDSVTFNITLTCTSLPVVAYVDNNGNCVHDAGDVDMNMGTTVEIDSASVPIDTCSMLAGLSYRAEGPPGTVYTFRLLSLFGGLTPSCPSTGIIYDTVPATGTAAAVKYFALSCASTAFDLSVNAAFNPALAGGGANWAYMYISNADCIGTVATVKFNYSPKFTFNSVYPSTLTYTVTGTSVTINADTISNRMPKSILVKLTPVSTLTLGDTANSTFTVTPISGDANPANNIVVRCDTIRASFDPNNKSVTPTGDIAAGELLEYMLEFENDGNDTAYNIHIMDTLSSYLDVGSLRAISSTHKANVIRYEDGGLNIVKFDFPDIKLPDSSHHDVCRGMVAFSIKAKSTLAPGSVIANRVGIYFDINPVVMTNTVFSKIPVSEGVGTVGRLSQVELYPNPVEDVLIIKAAERAYEKLSIYNMTGQVIHTQDASQAEIKINTRSLIPGVYYISLKGSKGTRTLKFEKL